MVPSELKVQRSSYVPVPTLSSGPAPYHSHGTKPPTGPNPKCCPTSDLTLHVFELPPVKAKTKSAGGVYVAKTSIEKVVEVGLPAVPYATTVTS